MDERELQELALRVIQALQSGGALEDALITQDSPDPQLIELRDKHQIALVALQWSSFNLRTQYLPKPEDTPKEL